MSRAEWERRRELVEHVPIWPLPKEEAVIQRLVDSLLTTLFRPDEETTFRAHPPPELRDESVNWGDIGCTEVRRFEGGSFLVTIEEAAPEAVKLAGWVEGWLRKWGWDAEVRTEW